MDPTKPTLLLTGGTGFIGHHMVEHYLRNTDWNIEILDRYSYAGCMRRVVDVLYGSNIDPVHGEPVYDPTRVSFVFGDIRSDLSPVVPHIPLAPDYIIHAAAETHVDRSLESPLDFVQSNVNGTFNMLQLGRYYQELGSLKKFVHVSTDEVYGPAPPGVDWKEWERYRPSNPYSATKAGADMLSIAWATSFRLPVLTSHTMNNFGERQHHEKMVTKTIRSLLAGEPCIVHGLEGNIGSRKWLHARNHADALLFLLTKCPDLPSGDIVNVVGEVEMNNLQIVELIANEMGVTPQVEHVDFHSTRPGHDLRYSLDGTKLTDLGWKAPVPFEESMRRTIRWTLDHPQWLSE